MKREIIIYFSAQWTCLLSGRIVRCPLATISTSCRYDVSVTCCSVDTTSHPKPITAQSTRFHSTLQLVFQSQSSSDVLPRNAPNLVLNLLSPQMRLVVPPRLAQVATKPSVPGQFTIACVVEYMVI